MTSPRVSRVQRLNDAAVRPDGDYVLYWMIANRRASSNFALEYAVHRARQLDKPLVVLEALRVGYEWASDRIHRFVIDGMVDNQRAFRGKSVLYVPYVEQSEGDGKGLLEAWAANSCAVVTDDFPCFFLPRMVRSAARSLGSLGISLEQVDANGMVPMRAAGQAFPTAYLFRRWLQKNLPAYFDALPQRDPLAADDLPLLASIPQDIAARWPITDVSAVDVGALPIDHSVPVATMRGGSDAGREQLREFVAAKLDRYADERNQPRQDVTTGLSAYLHFGHISAHEVFAAVTQTEGWDVSRISRKSNGARAGWWGMSDNAEALLDQLITWRELGYLKCVFDDQYDQYESLPVWALRTLTEHADDPRTHVYSLEEFEESRTHDPLWNAAQTQLRTEGRMHNYLRMLWGKKILEWSESPPLALETMIHLNNRYALDGRNPNSYSGIFWVLGRFDRAWGPERAVYGKIRYMSSENTARKVRVKEYMQRYAQDGLV